MTYRDLLSELGLTEGYSIRKLPPGGEDRPNDLAQAWIDGDRKKVLEVVRKHETRIRAMPSTLSKRERIRALRLKGYRNIDIVRKLGCSTTYVATACRNMKTLKRSHRKANPQVIIQLRSQGLKLREIAATTRLSLWTVHRILKRYGAGSSRSATS